MSRTRLIALNIFMSLMLLVSLSSTSVIASNTSTSISVMPKNLVMDITNEVEIHKNIGANLKVSTKPDNEGVIKRLEIESLSPTPSGNWITFSIENKTNDAIDRILVIPHYNLTNSGVFLTNMDNAHIKVITPSEGFPIKREADNKADIFKLKLPARSVITFAAEITNGKLPSVFLWETSAYKDNQNVITSYKSILIGITIVLVLFSTLLAWVKKRPLLTSTAVTSWAILFYLCVDHYIFSSFFPNAIAYTGQLRILAEFLFFISLTYFLLTNVTIFSPRINLTSIRAKVVAFVVINVLAILLVPSLVASLTRLSLLLLTMGGLATLSYLSKHGHHYSTLILPAWIALALSTFVQTTAAIGILTLELSQLLLNALLVLTVILMSLVTIQQVLTNNLFDEQSLSENDQLSLAFKGAGDILWDLNLQENKLKYSPELTNILGHFPAEPTKKDWLEHIHPQDKLPFISKLDMIIEMNGGDLEQSLRLRTIDQTYHWFWLRAKPLKNKKGELTSLLGSLVDINLFKNREIELLDSPLYDPTTRLPKSALILEKLQSFLTFSPIMEYNNLAYFIIELSPINEYHRLSSIDLSMIDDYLNKISQPLQEKIAHIFLGRISSSQFCFALCGKEEEILNLVKQTMQEIETEHKVILATKTTLSAGGYIGNTVDDAKKIMQLALINLDYNKKQKISLLDSIEKLADNTNLLPQKLLENESYNTPSKLENAEPLKIKILSDPIKYSHNGTMAGLRIQPYRVDKGSNYIAYKDYLTVDQQQDLTTIMSALYKEVVEITDKVKTISSIDKFIISLPILHINMLSVDYFKELLAVIRTEDCNKISLQLDVTETLFLQNEITCSRIMPQLKELGVTFAWDNFGSDITPMHYLTTLPIDIIYLSQQLNYSNNARIRSLYHSLSELAFDLGINVIFKDIDCPDMIDDIKSLENNYVMGKIFGESDSFSLWLTGKKQKKSVSTE